MLERYTAERDEAEAAVRQLNLELENRVAERTAALDKSNQELRQSNADLQHFAYVASHDLQEPLRMVSSYMQLLANRYEGKLDAKADQFIRYAVDGAKRMQRLVQEFLPAVFASRHSGVRIQAGRLESVLARVQADLQARILETAAVITHDPLPELAVDESRMGQVLQNLVGNSLKFHKPEEPPRIHIGAVQQGSEWLFSVRDNGVGFEPQYAERIFIIFQRLHHVGAYEGTGIGLAIVKRIVEGHGGRAWAESTPGVGTTFWFTLPTTSKSILETKPAEPATLPVDAAAKATQAGST